MLFAHFTPNSEFFRSLFNPRHNAKKINAGFSRGETKSAVEFESR
jgi:hypothetical protein